jgi:hypothetical protein
MRFWRKLVLGFYIFSIRKYSRYRVKYLKFLPNTPLANPKSSPLFKVMTKYVSTQFEPTIREEMDYYIKHHYELEDLQEGLGMATWLEFMKKTENLEGNILELGIFRGGLTVMTGRFLKKLNSKKKVFACDAFIGLPYDDKFSLVPNVKGLYSETNAELVQKKFQEFNVSEKISLVEGLFEETLYEKLSDKKFSLVLVDCDLYDATKYCMEFVYPRLTKGGVIMFDDYDRVNRDDPVGGETKAVDEFCESNNLTVNLFPEPHIIKPHDK